MFLLYKLYIKDYQQVDLTSPLASNPHKRMTTSSVGEYIADHGETKNACQISDIVLLIKFLSL